MNLKIHHPTGIIEGQVSYGGSKSISNRVLIIQHLCSQRFEIENLSKSDDTASMVKILQNIGEVNDVHHAGTTFRFLTSILAFRSGVQILTGSTRMKERPIGPLVEALRTLGARIEYVENEGYPPLRIGEPSSQTTEIISISGGISSQFISSLLLVAPSLPKGLKIKIEGELVSKPYVMMTLKLMNQFGINYLWEQDQISIEPQEYKAQNFFVESDWSSASYYYSIAALSKRCRLELNNLQEESLQADAAISKIGNAFGINSLFDQTLIITKESNSVTPFLEYDFIASPDIAQTVFVMCGGLGVNGLFSGLKTLKIKETDRILACKIELEKIGVFLSKAPQKFSAKSGVEYYMEDGKAEFQKTPVFNTYQDHRMAMAFAPLALLHPIQINDAEVVSKSYPNFWKDLINLGFDIKEI